MVEFFDDNLDDIGLQWVACQIVLVLSQHKAFTFISGAAMKCTGKFDGRHHQRMARQ